MMLRSINIGRAARWLPHVFMETQSRSQQVFLTFDDGPDAAVLPALLDVLASFKVKATFFCIGRRLAEHPDLARRIVTEGHSLGNHSYLHQRFFQLPLVKQWDEILRTEELIVAAGGTGKLFRPPQGRIDILLALKLKRHGFRIVHWNVDSCDYSQDAYRVSRSLESRILCGGDIVLMHDDHALCCDELKKWLPRWLDKGLQFGTP
jgi:peptidoglycan/xylan/chitin deacetylase (PgdA/CDA1 family)